MKYRIANIFAAAAALCTLLVGCSVVQEEPVNTTDRQAIRFTASVGTFQVKATDSAFENGDQIGIFADNWIPADNVQATYRDGSLELASPLYWSPEMGYTDEVPFRAYYPYNPEYNRYWNIFTVRPDQSTEAGYRSSDLLEAMTYARPKDGDVHFTFRHAFSKLVISIDNRLADTEIADVYLSEVYGRCEVYPGGMGAVNAFDKPGTIKTGKGYTPDGKDAWVVIIPGQSVKPNVLITTTDGRQFTTFPIESIYFSPNYRYRINVVLDENTVSTELSQEVTEWVDDEDFQFSWPAPENWTVIGNILGSNWDTDFWMASDGNCSFGTGTMMKCMYTRIDYLEGQEFKFRKDGDWEFNLGLPYDLETNVVQPGEVYVLEQGGNNIRLPRSGRYALWLEPGSGLFQVDFEAAFEDSEIVIDGDFSDWDRLNPDYVSVAYSLPDAPHTAMHMMKAYADASALYVYFEYDLSAIAPDPNSEWVPFHIYLNSDGNDKTGGTLHELTKNSGLEFMLESFLYADGYRNYQEGGFYKWNGGDGEEGWNWEDYSYGVSAGAGSGNAYEIRLDRHAFPLANVFKIAVDIQEQWEPVGLLPNANMTESNPNGYADLLPVYTVGSDVPQVTTIADVLNGVDGQYYTVTGTVTQVLNTNYGNYYIADSTGELYIYGTVNAKGLNPRNAGGWFTDEFGLVPGDVVTVVGPRKLYNTTVELVDVQILDVQRTALGALPEFISVDGQVNTQYAFIRSAYGEPSVSTGASWISCEMYPIGDQWYQVAVSIEANPTSADRSSYLEISADGMSRYIQVYQGPGEVELSSIQEVVDSPDGTLVTFTSVVYALSTRGFMVFDGKYSILVYTASAPAVQLGDAVKINGTKTTYNNVPEISNNNIHYEVVSSGNELMPLDDFFMTVTPEMMENPIASISVPVRMEGTLTLTNNGRYDIRMAGAARNAQIYWPVDELGLSALEGQYVEVEGFYLGYNNAYQYILATGVKVKEAEGPVTLAWSTSVPGSIALGYNRLAYANSGALLVSDGEYIHALSPYTGEYWKQIAFDGIKPVSIDSDEAGNIIMAEDVQADIDWSTGTLTSGTEITIYTAKDLNENLRAITLPNNVYGTVGGFRVSGDIANKGTITGFAGSASYWIGFDMADYAAVANYYGMESCGPAAGSNTVWSPIYAACIPYGEYGLHEGVLYRGYDGAESVQYRKDAYTPQWAAGDAYEPWTLVSSAGAGGNENQNNMDIITYNGRKILAFTQGFHFTWTGFNADIYVLDVTDIYNPVEIATVRTYDWILSETPNGQSGADVLLRKGDEGLELYAIHSASATIAKFYINL